MLLRPRASPTRRRPEQRTAKAFVFPVILGVNLLLAALLSGDGTAGAKWVPVLAGVSLMSAWLAEVLFPFATARGTTAERRADWMFFAMTALVDSGLVACFELVRGPGGASPAEPLSVLLALCVWELGSYWAHRLGHTWPLLWRFHALHHAPSRLTALNNFRLHPFDLILKDSLALGAVGLCGFDAATLMFVAVIKNCVVAFQHANADLRHGWLNRVVSTNAAHRFHHSAAREEGNSNFGTVLLIWDVVFRTLRVPREGDAPVRFGLFEPRHYPTNELFRSLLSPFCWRRCTAGDERGVVTAPAGAEPPGPRAEYPSP